MNAILSPGPGALVLAHGIGSRADLPLPLSFVVVGGGLAVAVSFVILTLWWISPRLAPTTPAPRAARGLDRALTSRWLSTTGQALTLTLLLVVVTAGLFGPREIPRNVAPWALYVTFWVGLVPLSLVAGPLWAAVNPLRLAYRMLLPVVRGPRRPDLADRLGLWPAAAGLAIFAWVELASPERSDPRRVGWYVLTYCLLQLAGATVVGDRWFARGDAFEVYARLIGQLSPLQILDGRLRLVSPLRRASATEPLPGITATLLVLIGSTAFDGLTRTRIWQDGPAVSGEAGTGISTVALVGCTAVISAAYLLATRWLTVSDISAPDTAPDARPEATPTKLGQAPRLLAPTLIPIAVGYAVAHYFSLFLLDGQTTYVLASDPYGTGWNLFGTAGHGVNYALLSDRLISVVQVGAIVTGHVVAAVLAHDRILALTPDAERRHATARQIPLLLVMIALTLGGLSLLLGS